MTTLGCFNTLDGKGDVTPFADVLLLTEADPAKVHLPGYHTFTCARQRDLMIATRLDLRGASVHYKRALPFAVAKVTPNRGTFWVTGRVDGEKVALLVEHRINAAFPPYKRGEGLFRRLGWETHTALTLRIVRRLKRRGFTVYGGGDPNVPRGVRAYRGVLHEVGTGLDRLGSTRPLTNVEVLSRNGSDHHRLRATVR